MINKNCYITFVSEKSNLTILILKKKLKNIKKEKNQPCLKSSLIAKKIEGLAAPSLIICIKVYAEQGISFWHLEKSLSISWPSSLKCAMLTNKS